MPDIAELEKGRGRGSPGFAVPEGPGYFDEDSVWEECGGGAVPFKGGGRVEGSGEDACEKRGLRGTEDGPKAGGV